MVGPTCSTPPSLLTLYGGVATSHAVIDVQMRSSNEFQIRFRSEEEEGVIMYMASRYKNGSVPAFYSLVYLSEGRVTCSVVMKRSDTVHSVSVPLVNHTEWNTVTLTISSQRLALQLNHWTHDIVSRVKLPDPVDPLLSRPSIIIGGVMDATPLSYLHDTIGLRVPHSSLTGMISEVSLNGASLMGSISSLSGVTLSDVTPPCGVNPCNTGTCSGDGQCSCHNDLVSGDTCNETLTMAPVKLTAGYISYHKEFDVGTHIDVTVLSGEGTVLYVPPQYDGDEVLVVSWDNLTLPHSNPIHYLSFHRKLKTVSVYSGEDLVYQMDYPSSTRLPKRFYIGHPFTGTLLSVRVGGSEVAPLSGSGLSVGRYPPCYNHSCLNEAQCVETSDTTYTCNCTEGYTGQYCSQLIDRCQPSPCNDTSRCYSVDGVSHLCVPCPAGYRGHQCEEKAICDTMHPCSHGNVTGTCTETEDSYVCDCGDGKDRMDCDLSKTCAMVECQNTGQCVELEDDFVCECPPQFVGRYCDVPVDNCDTDTCLNGGTCVSVFYEKKYFCLCPSGYSGDRCEVEDDMCANSPCHNNATCATLHGTFSCDCPHPYTGHDCSISPCTGYPCNMGECVLLQAEPHCECYAGYTGEWCNEDIDECDSPDACSRGRGICTNSVGGYECQCDDAFLGDDCEIDVDDCAGDPCNGHGLCMDGFGKYTCLCDALYTGDTCTELVDKCESQPCANEAECHNYGIDYFCICPPGYEGRDCSVRSDECARHRCQHGTCVGHVNGYTCECNYGYQGVFCERDIDECAVEDPCQNGGICTNTRGSFSCSCPMYYSGEMCEVELGECHTSPCLNGGECIELGVPGEGHECRCLEGWTGPVCQERSAECDNNPCLHGGKCRVGDEGHYCECEYPHTGLNCDHLISVPHLTTPQSVISISLSTDEQTLNLRFRPSRSGYVLQITSRTSGDQLNIMYTEEKALAVDMSVRGRRSAVRSTGHVIHSEWNSLTVVMRRGDSYTLTLNSVPDTVSGLRGPDTVHIGDGGRSNSFIGCVYNVDQGVMSGVTAGEVRQCEESGNTCVKGEEGVCGSGGECDRQGQCLCPLGFTGQYCEVGSGMGNPMFTRRGFLLLDTPPRRVRVGVRGNGPLLTGVDKEGRSVVEVDVGVTSLKLVAGSVEEVFMKGYHGTWMDVTITLDSEYVELTLSSGESLFTPLSGEVVSVYVGGAPHLSRSMRGCLTDLYVDDRAPTYSKVVDVYECTMRACDREDLCGNARCVSNGPRHHSCVCGEQTIGSQCDATLHNQTPRFQGNSYLKLKQPEARRSADLVLSLVFKADQRSGLLFTTEQTSAATDFLTLRLVRGRVVLRFDLGAGPTQLRCPRRVDDGEWHFVHVTLRAAHAVLLLDKCAGEAVSRGGRHVLNVGPHIYIGGSPSEDGVVGCVESVALWDTPLTLSQSVESSNVRYCQDNIPESSIYNFRL